MTHEYRQNVVNKMNNDCFLKISTNVWMIVTTAIKMDIAITPSDCTTVHATKVITELVSIAKVKFFIHASILCQVSQLNISKYTPVASHCLLSPGKVFMAYL